MRLVVIAGGESSRFWPLTRGHKATFTVMGKPLILHILHNLPKKITKVVVIESPTKPITGILAEHDDVLPVPVESRVQPEPIGTWDAIVKGAHDSNENVMVLAGHHINKDIIHKLSKFSKEGLVCFETERPEDYGIVTVENNRIVEINEKPKHPASNLAVKSCYIISPGFVKLLSEMGSKNAHHYLLEEAWTAWLKEHPAEFFTIDNLELPSLKYPWHILDIMRSLFPKIKGRHIRGDVADSAIIEGDVIIEEGAKVLPHAIIKGPAYIGAGAIIGDHSLVRESFIETGAVIGFGSEVVRSLVGPNAKMHHAFFGDSVAGESSSLGFGTTTANKRLDRSNIKTTIKGKQIDTKRSALGVIIGSNAKTGVNVSLMPGAILGKQSFVGPGTIFKGILEDGKRAYVKQEVIVE